MNSTKAVLGYNQVDFHQQHRRRIITPSPPPRNIVVHQSRTIHHEKILPSYHQVANTSSLSHAHVYQELTEV
jgi:hypothetical protein